MSNHPYSEFDRWLGDSEASNWNEYIREQVGLGIIPTFTQRDWNSLEAAIAHKPAFWLQRCVVSLGKSRHAKALPLLKTLLAHADRDTQILAAYELDWAEEPIEHELGSVIRRLYASIPEPERSDYPEIESLLKKSER
ncbi:HEAT repeat domain-containing protein [Pseudomonas sp. NPDC089406]|uniref:HEAT repeat domain-containing protein n=1 Tax=Pseudomonas sp. NPDC089406 TaxID=3364463 RepID=UPI00384E976E